MINMSLAAQKLSSKSTDTDKRLIIWGYKNVFTRIGFYHLLLLEV